MTSPRAIVASSLGPPPPPAVPRGGGRRPAPPRLSLAPTTAAFIAITLVVLLSVIAADRMMVRSHRTEARLDAARTALITSTFVSGQVQSLRGLHAVFLDDDAPSAERVDEVIEALGTEGMQFRRLWVVDPVGRVLSDQRFGTAIQPGATRLTRIDTSTSPNLARLVQAAAGTGAPQVWAAPGSSTGGRGFLILDPVVVDGRVAGFLAASVPDAKMEEALRATADPARETLLVLSGSDTVAQLAGALDAEAGEPSATRSLGDPITDTVGVALPSGVGAVTGNWRVVVQHRHDPIARIALWGVAGLFLFVLGLALRNERRQLQRIADRSRELEHLSSELLRANRTKSEFLANVSHELRTPLNAIVGFAELLREGIYGGLSSRQLVPLDRINASAHHLKLLVDQVLDLAKIAAGRLEVHAEPVSLRPFVLDVATEIESLVSERKLALSLAMPAMLPKVRTDPTHLRQILLNLIGNAIKFTPSGSVTVRGRLVLFEDAPAWNGSAAVAGGDALRAQAPDRKRPWVALQVVDTGIGIDPRDQRRIFEEFEQVNPGARGDSMHRGTGLGLPLSRRLAHILGGEITVESASGAGATFTLWFPVDPADLSSAGALGARPPRVAVGTIQDGHSTPADGARVVDPAAPPVAIDASADESRRDDDAAAS